MATTSMLASVIPRHVSDIPAERKQKHVDSFFCHFNSWYPVVDEANFRSRYSLPGVEAADSKHGRKPEDIILRFMILALGAFVGSSDGSNEDLVFFIEARKMLSFRLLESGSITLVQALILMVRELPFPCSDEPNPSPPG